MIKSDENDKDDSKNFFKFIKKTYIELYKASNLSALISFFRNISLTTQIYVLFIMFISVYCFINAYYRFDSYADIFTPKKEGDVFYDFMIENLLKKQNNYLINFEEINYIENIKLGEMIQSSLSIYVKEISINKFFLDKSLSDITDDLNGKFFKSSDKQSTENNIFSSTFSINTEDIKRNINNNYIFRTNYNTYYFKELTKLYYLLIPLFSKLSSILQNNIDTTYLILYPLKKTIFNNSFNITHTKEIISSEGTSLSNLTTFFQYPLNSFIKDGYDDINFVPYDFSTDPIPFFYYSEYNQKLIDMNWYNIKERMVLDKKLSSYDGKQMILKEMSDNFYYYKNIWKMTRIEVGEYYLFYNILFQYNLRNSERIPFITQQSKEIDRISYFFISNEDPNFYLNDKKLNYWIPKDSRNFDLNTEKNLIMEIPDFFSSLYRYGMVNKNSSLNKDNINISLMKMYMMKNLSLYYNIHPIFEKDSFFSSILYYVNIHHNLISICEKIEEINFNTTNLLGSDYNIESTLDSNIQIDLGIDKKFEDEIGIAFNKMNKSDKLNCRSQIEYEFCQYLNLTQIYHKLKELEIDCFNNKYLYLDDSENLNSNNLNCYCVLFKCLNTDDFDYLNDFQDNPFNIQYKTGNISFEKDCLLELSSINNGESETFRMRNNYSKGYNHPLQTNMFFVFSNETKINNIFKCYIDNVSRYIRFTVSVYIVALIVTLIIAIFLLYTSSEKIVKKCNTVASINFIDNLDTEENYDIYKKPNDSQASDCPNESNYSEKQEMMNIRKKSILMKNTGSSGLTLQKMKTIKEQESEVEESKPLTFRKDDKELKKDKESDLFFKGNQKINESIDSDISHNFITGNKEDKQENNIIIKNEEIDEHIDKDVNNKQKIYNYQSIKGKTNNKLVIEEEKDELDEILDLLKNNSDFFALNINFEKVLFKESINHKLFDGFFKENIKLQEFLLKTPVLLEEKYYEYFHNRQFIFEFFELECFEFDMKYRNFLFKFDDICSDQNTFRQDSNLSLGNILNEKRKDFYSRVNDYILLVYFEEGEVNENLKRDKLDSAICYYIDNILSKWIKKINDYNKFN